MSNNKRIALVTGAIGGIGTAICQQLAGQGCKVYANYYPPMAAEAESWLAGETANGADIHLIGADVSSADDTRKMISDIEAADGQVDILVNAAGITRDGTLKKMPEENWADVINTNLNSIYNATQPVFGGMCDRGFGRVINISSVNGQRGQFGQTNYATAKAGMHGFTMSAAQEGARKGVTVNTISPGYIETAMTAAIPEDVLKQIVSGIPAGKMGQPEDIATMVGFLASDQAGYVTGANIPVNGGLFMSF